MEVFDQRGMVEEFLAADVRSLAAPLRRHQPSTGRPLPTRYPYLFGLLQTDTEDILERFAERLGVSVQWSTEVVGFDQPTRRCHRRAARPNGTGSRAGGLSGGLRRRPQRRPSTLRHTVRWLRRPSVTLLGDVELGEPQTRLADSSIAVRPVCSGDATRHHRGQPWSRAMVTEYHPNSRTSR